MRRFNAYLLSHFVLGSAAIAFLGAVFCLVLLLWPWGVNDERSGAASLGRPSAAESLSAAEAQELQATAESMLDAQQAVQALARLRDRLNAWIDDKSPKAPYAMVVAVQALAPCYPHLDADSRIATLGLLSDVLIWYERHQARNWLALLEPAEAILSAALQDAVPEACLSALGIVRACWRWLPPEFATAAERKRLAAWHAALGRQALSLLKHRNVDIRAEATATLGAAPDASLAAQTLPLLKDEAAKVRRRLLLALADRPELLPSEQVAPLLNDSDWGVATTAHLVLRCRGLDSELIALAKRLTHPSELVRANAAAHVLGSCAVDQLVWLQRLSEDESARVRAAAAEALAELGIPRALQRLQQLAASDPDQQVRAVAKRLLDAGAAATGTTSAAKLVPRPEPVAEAHGADRPDDEAGKQRGPEPPARPLSAARKPDAHRSGKPTGGPDPVQPLAH